MEDSTFGATIGTQHRRNLSDSSASGSLAHESVADLATAHALTAKRSIARQLAAAMRQAGVTKSELSRRMRTSRASLDRLLDADNPSLTLASLIRAANALELRVRIEMD